MPGIIALIALRILYLAAFGDHAGRKEGLTSLFPDRGDIVDRDGEPLARTIDAWTIAIHPTQVIGDKLALAQGLAELMPEHSEEQYFALLRSGKPFFYLRRRASPAWSRRSTRSASPAWRSSASPTAFIPRRRLPPMSSATPISTVTALRAWSARSTIIFPTRRRAATPLTSRSTAVSSRR